MRGMEPGGTRGTAYLQLGRHSDDAEIAGKVEFDLRRVGIWPAHGTRARGALLDQQPMGTTANR